MSELVRKQRTMHVIEEQLALLSARGPVLIVFEDTHWADPTSIELLGRILRRVAGLRAMVIANFRPEFTPPWLGLGHVTLLTLNQLGRRQVNELIDKTAAGVTLPEPVIEQIVAKAQGVPLFVEEITRSVLASGALEERDGQYHLEGRGRVLRHPRDAPGQPRCPARPAWPGQGCGTRCVDHRTGVLVRTCGGRRVRSSARRWRLPWNGSSNPTWSRSAVSRRTQSTASSMRSFGMPPTKPS